MASGLVLVWPMILFMTLGSHFEAFASLGAAAALVGAAAGIACGAGMDRGQREGCLQLVSLAASLAMLPAVLGIAVMHACVWAETSSAPAPLGAVPAGAG